MYMIESTVVKDATSPEYFNIRQHLTCNSRNVIYRVRCKTCDIFGIGECEFPRQRLMDYVRAASTDNSMPTAVLEKHFADSLHSIADLEFMLLEHIPDSIGVDKSCLQTERVRLEELWMNKLHAHINVKRQSHASFTGYHYSNARYRRD